MAGWLTNDITKLSGIVDDACKMTDCKECMFKKYSECPGELVYNIVISVENLRSAVTRCENMLKEQL